jgi:hypothetical protein
VSEVSTCSKARNRFSSSFLDADAVVLDLEAQQQFAVAFPEQFGAQPDAPLFGKLDCVADVVVQGLAQAQRVAAQPCRHLAGVDVEHQPARPGFVEGLRAHVVEYRVQGEVVLVQLDRVGLDPGDVEDVVDHRQQVVCRGIDLGQPLRLLRRRLATPQQVREADDGVHRRADLVADVGQEAALGQVGLFRRLLGRGQLDGARDHLLLQLVAMPAELFAAGGKRRCARPPGRHAVQVAREFAKFVASPGPPAGPRRRRRRTGACRRGCAPAGAGSGGP